MKTIPHKVIYTKEEFAELKQEFEEQNKTIEELHEKLHIYDSFLEKLRKTIDFDESVIDAIEFRLIIDHASDSKPKLIKR
jgi:Tfp pilus assembly protein PilN